MAHATAVLEGNGEWLASATPDISTKPLRCAIAVSRNAFARRDPYPPTKSLVPQEKTAAKLKLVGADRDGSVILLDQFRENETTTQHITQLRTSTDCGSARM
jgi:hypothetical protein